MSGLYKSIEILLIGENPLLSKVLFEAGFSVVQVSEGADLYHAAEQYQPAAVLVHADSPSRDTLEHLALLSRKFPQPTLLMHSGEDAGLNQLALDLGMSAYVTDGMSAPVIKALIDVSIRQKKQVDSLRRELSRSQQTLAKRKLVDAAKCLLMERYALSETQAYERLKRDAMSSRQNLIQRAREILQKESP